MKITSARKSSLPFISFIDFRCDSSALTETRALPLRCIQCRRLTGFGISCRMAMVFIVWALMAFLSVGLEDSKALAITGSTVGINYGQIADNLPPPAKVAELLKALKVTKVKLYDWNPAILKAFANSDVELVVGIGNGFVAGLMDTQAALSWVTQNIQPYLSSTKVTGFSVGNEVYTGDDAALKANLVPAMRSIHTALVSLGLDSAIKISTAHSLSVLTSSYPPSAGAFDPAIMQLLREHLDFLAVTGAPFWINAYPFFAYKDNAGKISLDYALLKPNPGTDDPNTHLHYDNMLYAMVDAVYSALGAMGYGNLEVRISETGWPSKGDADELGASIQNAATYNRNLLQRLLKNQGTPMKPNSALQAYIFALFNEDLKNGPTSERNYGLFKPDESMVYNIGLEGGLTVEFSAYASSAQRRYNGAAMSIALSLLLSGLCTLYFVLPRLHF